MRDLPIAITLFAILSTCDLPFAEAASRLPEHESITYNVKWLGVTVGTITASINGVKKIRDRDAYELEITAKTNDLVSSVYPINDRYVSYMDVEKLYTLRHEVYRREGRYKKDAVTDFDHASGEARFRNLLDKSEKTIPIPAGVQDPVSMAYFFRTKPVKLCERMQFAVYNNESVYLLCGVAEAKIPVRIPGIGIREVLRIQPYAMLQGDMVRKGKATIYISCDDKQIPLKGFVRAPLFTEITAYYAEEAK
ncbi:MAG: DUF3108 domain-containing protein [Candidatus Omnitrophica bacterium]|nr:DUF3108 domain-containing protein [Candidatus Omnitrophota bacterium]